MTYTLAPPFLLSYARFTLPETGKSFINISVNRALCLQGYTSHGEISIETIYLDDVPGVYFTIPQIQFFS